MRIVVLDLDETIVHCQDARPEDLGAQPCFPWQGGTVVLRPHFTEFITFLLDNFDHICVFTAAQETYARYVVEQVLGGTRFVKSVWFRDHCEIKSSWEGGVESCLVYKPLQGKTTPCGSPMDSPYTMMVDDRDEVTQMNLYAHSSRGSHYKIAPFYGDPKDRALLECIDYIRNWIRSMPCP